MQYLYRYNTMHGWYFLIWQLETHPPTSSPHLPPQTPFLLGWRCTRAAITHIAANMACIQSVCALLITITYDSYTTQS